MRDVPGHTAHLLTSCLSEALKLAARVGVFAVVDEAALFSKQTAPVLRGQAPSALGRTNDISRHLKECLLVVPPESMHNGLLETSDLVTAPHEDAQARFRVSVSDKYVLYLILCHMY